MSVPGYRALWLIGLIVGLARWTAIFLGSYLVNELTHSTIQVQLVGVCLFAPMFAGGAPAGVISDRLDRGRTIALLLAVLIPASVLMALLTLSGDVEAWMIYPYVFIIGVSHVVDMTSRRSLVYDVVGQGFITNALALESLAMTTGTMVGSLTAGAVISLLGVGEVFLVIGGLYGCALLVLLRLKLPARQVQDVRQSAGVFKDLTAAFRYAYNRPSLVSILGVTVIMNLFYFSFIPLVPVFGERLEVGALLTSLLLSANAFGSIVGASLIARGLPLGRGVLYVGGGSMALLCLIFFALAGWYPAALLSLLIAGFGLSGFATMQGALVMTNTEDEMRGRALGLVSMGIGVVPFTMLLLGSFAQAVGPSIAVMASASIGLSAMAIWNLRRPESLRLQ